MARQWQGMAVSEVIRTLQSDAVKGLGEKEAGGRLAIFGPNEIGVRPSFLYLGPVAGWLKKPLYVMLTASAVLAGLMEDYAVAGVILLYILVNAVIRGVLTGLSGKNITGGKLSGSYYNRVIRDGKEKKIKNAALVPGDIVLIGAGEWVPADIMLIETAGLEINGSPFEGKLAYMGTWVTKGKGRGIVLASGMATEAGRALAMKGGWKAADTLTENQAALVKKSKGLAALYIFLGAVLVLSGVYYGHQWYPLAAAAVCLIAAVVPYGLPEAFAYFFSAAAKRAAGNGVVIRSPAAFEDLHRSEIICLNKTGMITQDRMMVEKVLVDGAVVEIEGDGYNPRGKFKFIRGKWDKQLDMLLKTAALCNNASLLRGRIRVGGQFRVGAAGGETGEWDIEGTGTEGAILVLAARGGVWREQVERVEKRVAELPFDSMRRRMTVFYQDGSGLVTAYTKGSPGVVVGLCSHLMKNGEPAPMSDADRREILSTAAEMAGSPLRVLAFAYKQMDRKDNDYSAQESGMVFIGLCGLSNDLRDDSFISVRSCLQAGYSLTMVTADHTATAGAVAREAGILSPGGRVISGGELDGMSEEDLAGQAGRAGGAVFADLTPDGKARVIRALKRGGRLTAAACDGPGNAAALREAHVSMASYDSSLPLTSRGFSAVVSALAESRAFCENLLKYTAYVLSSGMGLAAAILLSIPAGIPLPLLPVQIVWAGLLTGGLPAFVISSYHTGGIIVKKPVCRSRNLFLKSAGAGLLTALCALLLFEAAYKVAGSMEAARTVALNAFIFIRLAVLLDMRPEKDGITRGGAGGNFQTAAVVFMMAALQVTAVSLPLGQAVLGLAPPAASMWAPVIFAALIPGAAKILQREIKHIFKHKITYFGV